MSKLPSGPRFLLISPPWRTPYAASLALATLRPLLARQGIECDELHGTLLFPYTMSPDGILEQLSGYLFAPHLYPSIDRKALVKSMVGRYVSGCNVGEVMYPADQVTADRFGINESHLTTQLLEDIDRAGICVERMVSAALRSDYDIIGFSATFEVQLPAALAVAKRIKEARPEVKIILGGAACFESQGDGLATSFRFLDAVCHTEGEAVIGPLIRALRGEQALSSVPGIAYVDAQGALQHNPSPTLLTDLDSLPVPEYEPFIEQFQRSPWAKLYPPKFFFETSRGCWWGQKHLCTFCGLNAEGLTFRRKSPERAYREIRSLYERYEAYYLQATDNILDMAYLKHVMPQLAAMPKVPERRLEIFFEIKSNLRRDQVWTLADGGVIDVQPGIESFSDGVLRLMDKGATGLGQVQFIKWAFEAGLGLVYNLLIRNPGERAEWYQEMVEFLPSIVHLPPPMGIVAMNLERFSPYFNNRERYGIRNVRPMPYYAELYPDPQVDLGRIAYVFEYDHDLFADQALLAIHRQCAFMVTDWQQSWKAQPASYVDRDGAIFITDHRKDAIQRQALLSGRAAELFRYLDRVRTLAAIRRRFAGLDPALLACLLGTWLHRRWLCKAGDRYLSVLPCRERRPFDSAAEDDAESRDPTAPSRLRVIRAPSPT